MPEVRDPWFRRRPRDDVLESARRHLADAEARGRVYAAIIRGEGCCQVNDPEYSRDWWVAALAEYEDLERAANSQDAPDA